MQSIVGETESGRFCSPAIKADTEVYPFVYVKQCKTQFYVCTGVVNGHKMSFRN